MRLPSRSTIAHFRFKFSIFLTPVFFFCLSEQSYLHFGHALLLFLILTLSIFPASHGYNSFYDQDEGSIGGLEKPPEITSDLYFYSLALEGIGILLSLWINPWIAALLFIYGVFSKLYSHPKVRLKGRPWAGCLTVAFFQGAVIYWVCALSMGFEGPVKSHILWNATVSTVLIASSYPLTQVYQHGEDKKRGDRTLSSLLGIRGTFLFSLAGLGVSLAMLGRTWGFGLSLMLFLLMMTPTAVYFMVWMKGVWRDPAEANFKRVHGFLKISSLCSILGFCAIGVLRQPSVFPFAQASDSEQVVEETGVSTQKIESGEPWFVLKNQSRARSIAVKFETKKGETLSEEAAEISADGQFQNYSWRQHQTQDEATIVLKDNVLKFSFLSGAQKKEEKKPKEKILDLNAEEQRQLVVPPLLTHFIVAHWNEIESNESVDLKVASPDHMDIFSFVAKKEESPTPETVGVILKPTSIFVSIVVSPIHFIFNKSRKIVSIHDIFPPVLFKNNSGDLSSKKTDINF